MVDSSQLTFLPISNSHDTKTTTNIKYPARLNLDIVPQFKNPWSVASSTVNGGGDSFWKWKNFQISRACDLDLDLGSGHTAYRCASLIDLYLHAEFHWNQWNFLWMDVRTYGRTDGHLSPTLLGRLRTVDLKITHQLYLFLMHSHTLEGRGAAPFMPGLRC